MSTTVAVIEILVVGLFGSVWLLLAAGRLGGVDWGSVEAWMKEYDGWSAAITIAGALATYQIGWLINGVSRALMRPFAERVQRKLHDAKGLDYETVRATVYHKGSDRLIQDLVLEQSVIRLARGGIINFALLAALLIGYGGGAASVAIVPLALVVGCALQWHQRNRRYYERIIAEYDVVVANHTIARPNDV